MTTTRLFLHWDHLTSAAANIINLVHHFCVQGTDLRSEYKQHDVRDFDLFVNALKNVFPKVVDYNKYRQLSPTERNAVNSLVAHALSDIGRGEFEETEREIIFDKKFFQNEAVLKSSIVNGLFHQYGHLLNHEHKPIETTESKSQLKISSSIYPCALWNYPSNCWNYSRNQTIDPTQLHSKPLPDIKTVSPYKQEQVAVLTLDKMIEIHDLKQKKCIKKINISHLDPHRFVYLPKYDGFLVLNKSGFYLFDAEGKQIKQKEFKFPAEWDFVVDIIQLRDEDNDLVLTIDYEKPRCLTSAMVVIDLESFDFRIHDFGGYRVKTCQLLPEHRVFIVIDIDETSMQTRFCQIRREKQLGIWFEEPSFLRTNTGDVSLSPTNDLFMHFMSEELYFYKVGEPFDYSMPFFIFIGPYRFGEQFTPTTYNFLFEMDERHWLPDGTVIVLGAEPNAIYWIDPLNQRAEHCTLNLDPNKRVVKSLSVTDYGQILVHTHTNKTITYELNYLAEKRKRMQMVYENTVNAGMNAVCPVPNVITQFVASYNWSPALFTQLCAVAKSNPNVMDNLNAQIQLTCVKKLA